MTALRLLAEPIRTEPERSVVEAAQRGEPWAQAAILERYAEPVWSLVSRLLGRAGRGQAAEDTAQEALVAVLASLARYRREAGKLTSWVLTIAARKAIDEVRRRPPGVAAAETAGAEGDRPDRGAERRALGRAIEGAIEQLAPEFRATFILRAYHELDYGEIAEALGVDIGTVKSRLWRARAQLKAALAEVHEDDR